MRRYVQLFNDLPIAWKLLLTALIPLAAFIILGLQTYRSLDVLTEQEEQVDRVYVTQRTSAEYLRLIVDYETGFRGYVLTGQHAYLEPAKNAHQHLPSIEHALMTLVRPYQQQYDTVLEAERLVQRMLEEKEPLIRAVKAGQKAEALRYIEEGRGQVLMQLIRDQMAQFDRLEQHALNDALSGMAEARTTMVTHILAGLVLVFVLIVSALLLISRSITTPLAGLVKSVRSANGIVPTTIPVLARRDELGELTTVMNQMSRQARQYLADVRKTEEELRALNESLKASESKYRSIVDHAPFGIFTTHGLEVTFSNRYNRQLAGLDPDDSDSPDDFRRIIHPEDRERVLREYAAAIADDRPYETIFRFVRQDGTVRKVLSRRIPIRDGAGRTTMYQGFNIDITALDDMQMQLSRAERLATLGQVAAGIAHEIRNPLVGIGSTAALLRDEIDPNDTRRADLDVILDETRRLDRIVNQIIDYARPRELMPTHWKVQDLLEDVLKLLDHGLTAHRVSLSRSIPPELALTADRDQIKQVLLNLCQNALEAMPNGGELTVAAGARPRAGLAGLAIEVADNGPGISSEHLAHVFHPFFTSGKPQGTGLGLAICRNIVEAHHGDITLTSEPGRGTLAWVWLPLQPIGYPVGSPA